MKFVRRCLGVGLGASLLLFQALPGAATEAASSQVAAWLASQSGVKTWSADFVQTRTFKTLAQPLKEAGHVWFSAPGSFRWELGHPPKTIAVRTPDEMLLFYPHLKRVERYPVAAAAGPWREAMALLEAGFPRSQQEVEQRFNILSQKLNGTSCNLVLQPKSAAARKMMPQITIIFDTRSNALLGTELEFADGSTMRNDFKSPVLNPQLDPSLFSPKIPADYKVVEPLKK
ncbi:MAG TPA: outer membrane lipoprotein carrier protein LolA [Verrucomicrobiae bacterium]|nr:outer membrane lipoprotein carrier protein LolA [Verrucomicrobiae bacterium]